MLSNAPATCCSTCRFFLFMGNPLRHHNLLYAPADLIICWASVCIRAHVPHTVFPIFRSTSSAWSLTDRYLELLSSADKSLPCTLFLIQDLATVCCARALSFGYGTFGRTCLRDVCASKLIGQAQSHDLHTVVNDVVSASAAAMSSQCILHLQFTVSHRNFP